jgi:hypothetical protein
MTGCASPAVRGKSSKNEHVSAAICESHILIYVLSMLEALSQQVYQQSVFGSFNILRSEPYQAGRTRVHLTQPDHQEKVMRIHQPAHWSNLPAGCLLELPGL